MVMTAEERQYDEMMDRIFHPRHIAVVGVSSQGVGFGSGIVRALINIGFEGSIHCVNFRGGEFLGMKLYRSVTEIHHTIDFAVITTPAETVPAVLEECLQKGIAGVEVLSAGFSELGTPEGVALEEEVRRIARRGVRVVGPNCFGIYCPRSGLTLLPGPDLSRKPGSVAFLSQSGGMAIDLGHLGKWMGVGFSKVVSFGNGADLRETELLDYLARDRETATIAMYTEGVEDGPSFLAALRRATAVKPVILYKGGLSDAGSRAVTSHTASMSGSRAIWESLVRQANAVQVTSLPELVQTCLAFSMIPHREYHGISVVGGGGALGITACDAAERYGLAIPPLDEAISRSILDVLPKPGSSAKNPVDAANPHVPPPILKKALMEAARDPAIDLQILIQLLYHYAYAAGFLGMSVEEATPFEELAEAVGDVVRETGKPVLLVIPNNKQGLDALDVEETRRKTRQAFLEQGVPVFDEMEDALRAVRHVSSYSARKKEVDRE